MIKLIFSNRLLAFLAIVVTGLFSPVFAVDLLEMPSVQSSAASRALLLDVAPRGSESMVAVGTYGVIIGTDDAGDTWSQAEVPASVTLTGVHFPTPESGWAVGHDGLILHSSDGGKTWAKQLDGYQLNEQILSVANRIVAQFREQLEEIEAQEEPDEATLEDAEFMLEEAEFMLEGAQDDTTAGPVRPLLDVWFRNEQEGFVVGSYGMLLHTLDGGQNWELVSDRMDNAEAFHLNQIVTAPDGALFIAGEAGYVYRSGDGGENWETLEPGYDGSFYGIVVVPQGSQDYELLAYGLRGNLFRSIDGGETWESLDSGTTVTLMGGTRLEDGTVLLGGSGGVLMKRAPGAQKFEPAKNSDRQVIAAMSQMNDGNVLVAGLGGVRKIDSMGLALTGDSNE
jgi:photosystem II stability/assembly factor-like uncharacterized protein